MSDVTCDKRVSARTKCKVSKVVGDQLCCVAHRQKPGLEEAEMTMLRFTLGKTGMEKIRNDNIRGGDVLDVFEGNQRSLTEYLDIKVAGAGERDAQNERAAEEGWFAVGHF